MPYPISPTTYRLPFGDTIRVSSNRRFILVRHPKKDGAKPIIVLRSDSRSRLENGSEYRRDTDYLIDQAENTVTYYFNNHKEVSRG